MKVYVCSEWIRDKRDIQDGSWEVVKVVANLQHAKDWRIADILIRDYKEFEVEA